MPPRGETEPQEVKRRDERPDKPALLYIVPPPTHFVVGPPRSNEPRHAYFWALFWSWFSVQNLSAKRQHEVLVKKTCTSEAA